MNTKRWIRERVLTCRPRVLAARDALTIASTKVGNIALSFPTAQQLTRNDQAKGEAKGARGDGRDVHLKPMLQFQRNSRVRRIERREWALWAFAILVTLLLTA